MYSENVGANKKTYFLYVKNVFSILLIFRLCTHGFDMIQNVAQCFGK
jgi:hypothetical protein